MKKEVIITLTEGGMSKEGAIKKEIENMGGESLIIFSAKGFISGMVPEEIISSIHLLDGIIHIEHDPGFRVLKSRKDIEIPQLSAL